MSKFLFSKAGGPHHERKTLQKNLGFLLASLLLLTVSPPAFADMGPKPSVTLRLYIYNDQNYAVTLLGNTESTGPWSAPSAYGDWMGSREVWEAFQAYDAPEGYYFLGYFEEYFGDTEQTFTWGYYPPQKFYVLLYNMDTGVFSISKEPVQRYAFDSEWQVLFDPEDGWMHVYTNRTDSDQISLFTSRLLITLILELALGALVFGLREKSPAEPHRRGQSGHAACTEPCSPLWAVLSRPLGGLCALRRNGSAGLRGGSLRLLPLAALAGGQNASPGALRPDGQPALVRRRLAFERAPDERPDPVAQPCGPVPVVHGAQVGGKNVSF